MTTAAARQSPAHRILRGAYYVARNLPDRVLHQRRRNALQRRLSNGRPLRNILVVCHGNICRSPYLQAVLQKALPNLVVNSAGFFGGDRAVPDLAVALGAKHGFDLSQHRSRPLTKNAVGTADIVIVMDAYQARYLERLFPIRRSRVVIAGDLDPHFDRSRGIRDPWGGTQEVFESAFNRLDRCAEALVRILRRG